MLIVHEVSTVCDATFLLILYCYCSDIKYESLFHMMPSEGE